MTSVLIVDDHVDSCIALARLISSTGIDASCAASGEEALDRLDTEHVDLVIVDVMMPGMDGIEVLWRIRENPATRDLRVVVYTAALNMDIRERAMEHGATDYWVKSRMDFEEIREKLCGWLPCGQPAKPMPFDRPLV